MFTIQNGLQIPHGQKKMIFFWGGGYIPIHFAYSEHLDMVGTPVPRAHMWKGVSLAILQVLVHILVDFYDIKYFVKTVFLPFWSMLSKC